MGRAVEAVWPPTAYIWRMCGRFTRNYTWQQIQALYRLTVPAAIPNLRPEYTVCPTGKQCRRSIPPAFLLLRGQPGR